jgi:sugar phosphate isomerase/epimerase
VAAEPGVRLIQWNGEQHDNYNHRRLPEGARPGIRTRPTLADNQFRPQTRLLPPPHDRSLTIYRGALQRLAKATQPRDVRLLLVDGLLLADAHSAKSFLDAEDYAIVDVLYDVTNAAAIGEDPADGIRTLAERIKLVHLSDAPKGQWRHDPIGTGAIEFPAIRTALSSVGYASSVVIEVISKNTLPDLVASRARLQEMGRHFDRPPLPT